MAGKSFPPATQEALFSLVARLADNKYFLGRNYAEWCSGAPTLESAVAAAAMAQDELGHARALYPLLKTLAPPSGPSSPTGQSAQTDPEIDPETRTHFLLLSLLERPFNDWLDFVAANFLTDTALTVLFAAAQNSAYEPLAGRSRKVLQEEALHATHGKAWVRRLAEEGGAVRDACEAALRRNWAETLCWFGPAGAGFPPERVSGGDRERMRDDTGLLADAGILDAGPDTLRDRFLANIGPIITSERLNLPIRATAHGQFSLTEPLPWDRWDAATYRLAPARVQEAV